MQTIRFASYLLATASTAVAQLPVDFIALPSGPPHADFVVFDAARERIALHRSDGQPAEWNGSVFERRSATRTGQFSSFIGRGATRAVFDTRRGVTFAVDASSGDWSHDGRDWSRVGSGPRPTMRFAHALAYDSARDRIVLFGGNGGAQPALDDTWEWDGIRWRQRNPVQRPPGLQLHAMAFDPTRARVALFGGSDSSFTQRYETWEWDGTSWSRAAPVRRPTHALGSMVFDDARLRLVLATGSGGLWEWDGRDWTQASTSYFPPDLVAFDSTAGELVGFGAGDPYVWDGVAVTRRNTPPSAVGDVTAQRIVADTTRGHALTFGGARARQSCGPLFGNDTWTWDGTRWSRAASAAAPPARGHFGLVDAASRGRVVMFGGEATGTCTTPQPLFNDLWEWDGSTWTPGSNQNPPSARTRFALAWDSARQCAVLFGGGTSSFSGITPVNECWEWNGTSWSQALSPTRPSARLGAAMAFDPIRRRTVLFGGSAGSDETWEWDGSVWTQARPSTTPPPSMDSHDMFFDARRAAIILVHSGAAWSWNGTDWSSIVLARSLPPGPVAADPATGGWITPTHRIGRLRSADLAHVGVGCTNGTSAPVLAITAPILGNPAFRVEVLRAGASAPAAILFGVGYAPTTVAGCTIYPARPWLPALISTNAYGAGWLPLPLPIDPALRGLELHVQAATFDRSSGRGFVTTAAQRARLGDG